MSTVSALNEFKQLASVRLVATTNQSGTYYNGTNNSGVGATFTYATGALTLDSVAVSLNDYILFQGQTLAYQNGIYQCIQAGATGVAAILQRRGDFQCIEQIKGGQYVMVSAGSTNAGAIYVVVEPLPAAVGVPITSGLNNIVFASSIVAGEGTAAAKDASNNSLASVASVPASVVSGNLAKFADTAGTLADQGVAFKSVAGAAAAGGAAAQSFTDAFCTSGSCVVGNWNTQANAASVLKIVPGSGSFVVTSSADAGVGTFNYIITK